MAAAKRIRFLITDEALYAANAGRPFDRLGLLSVTRAHLSTKGRWPPVETYSCTDGALVDAMRARRLEVYRADPNQIRADYNQQHETERSYEGRCIWELLQNADDAMAPPNASSADLIGAKGLGFKSVLEFTDRPAVFSGPFSFEFDAARSRPLLELCDPKPPPLIFHLPHTAEPDRYVSALRKEGFGTIVRLPFRNAEARSEATDRLQELTPYFLLLSQHLAGVEIRFADGRRRTLTRSERPSGDLTDVRIRLTVREDDVAAPQDWRVWSRMWRSSDAEGKRLSTAVAVPAFEAELPELPLHVFFPTRETIGARFLIHAAFKLTENRNSLVRGENDTSLIKATATLAADVAMAIPPLQALRLFGDVVRGAPSSSKLPARRLQKAIADAVSASRFVPILGTRDRVAPGETRTWQHGLGDLLPLKSRAVAKERLVDPTIAAGFPILHSVFKARSLHGYEYAGVLAHVSCSSVADCRSAVAVAKTACVGAGGIAAGTLEKLALIPMWPTADGRFRPLADDLPLADAAADDWPSWLSSDVLHPDFGDAAGDADLNPTGRANWAKLLKGRLLRTREDWLAHALAPQVAQWSDETWSQHGWEALRTVRGWLGELDFRTIKPFVPGLPDQAESVREKLAHAMRAPYKNSWVPTVNAYASEEIQGPEGLAKYVRNRSDGFIIGKPKQANAVGSWKGLLRYLGVSWEPKLRRMTSWMPGMAGFQRATDQSFRYPLPDWRFEDFPDCLKDVGSVTVLKMLETLAPITESLPARWGKVGGADKVHKVPGYGSYAHWQLCCEPYLRCRPGIGSGADRVAPEAAYWPDDGLRSVTPVVELHQIDGARRKSLKALLVGKLRLKDELPADDETWLSWSQAIAREVSAAPDRLSLRDIRAFYETALDRRLGPGALKAASVVCESASGLVVVPGKSAIWIDEPDLAAPDVQEALRSAGLAVFPAQLSRGERSEALFGVRRASAVLKLRPKYLEVSKGGTEALQRRLRARRRALAVTFETKIKKWKSPNVEAVHGLTLSIVLGETIISTRSVAAYQDGDIWRVNIDFGRWDALARACVAGLPPVTAADLRRRVAAILAAPRDAVAMVLIEDGIPAYRLTDLILDEDDVEDPETSATAPVEDEPDAPPDIAPETTGPVIAPTLDEIRNTPEPETPAKLAKRSLYGSGAGKGTSGRGKTKAAAAEAAERASVRGLTAEAWFALAVERSLPDGWDARFNERDADARESDLIVSDGTIEWHVEVKNLTTERLYWSELERSKAESLPGLYFMALLVGTHEIGYHVYWVWDPLVQLGGLERRLDWVWSDTDEGPPLPPMKWSPAPGYGMPQKPPTRFNHVVRVTETSLEGFVRGRSDLQALWDRCRKPAGAD